MSETASTAKLPAFYCPGCGTRYFAPGLCNVNHPPAEIIPDPDMIPAKLVDATTQSPTQAFEQTAAQLVVAQPNGSEARFATFVTEITAAVEEFNTNLVKLIGALKG